MASRILFIQKGLDFQTPKGLFISGAVYFSQHQQSYSYLSSPSSCCLLWTPLSFLSNAYLGLWLQIALLGTVQSGLGIASFIHVTLS